MIGGGGGKGLGGLGSMTIHFQGAGEALVIIFRDFGEQVHSLGDLVSPAEEY